MRVLHEPREQVAIASELQGQLRRLEQLVRWHAMKAESLPSWDGWPHLGEPEPRIAAAADRPAHARDARRRRGVRASAPDRLPGPPRTMRSRR